MSNNFNFGQAGSFTDFNFTESGYTVPSELIFNFGSLVHVFNVLKGDTNNFSSIWVHNNKMYIGSQDTLTVIDVSTNTLYDWYSKSRIGRAGETLNAGDIVDINAL